MNWGAIGVVAETVGALGVIATLLYLATQVRQATRVAKADFFFRAIDGMVDFNLRVADNEALSELFWKTLEAPERLTEVEELRSRHLLSGLFRAGERSYFARRSDLIGEEIFRSHVSPMVRLSRTPGGARWLQTWGPGLDPGYLRALEKLQHPSEAGGREGRTESD